MKQRHLKSAILLALFGVVLGVYWPTLSADFLHWDDDINVFENPHIQGLTPENLRWMFTDFEQAIRYKALSWLAWGVVHELFGLNPFGYHLANVFLHASNAWLIFFLLLRLQRAMEVDVQTPHLVAAAIGSLLWTIHPLRVEPVAWITGLPYHLALLFLLGSAICYLRVDRTQSPWPQRNFHAAIALYLLAAMTYPIVLGFTAALVALDIAPLRRDLSLRTDAGRRTWLEKLPFAGIAGLMIAGTLYGRFFHVGEWFQAAGTESFTLAERLTQAGYVWIYYLWKPLWPTGLNPLYDTLLNFSPGELPFVLSTALFLAISAFLLVKHRRFPAAAALWLAHLGILVPMLGLTEKPHYPHDRYSIINGVLWSITLFALWLRLPTRTRNTGLIVGAAIAIILVALSWRQTALWKNDFTFFTRLAERTAKPDLRAAALMKLGNAHSHIGEDLTALDHYEKARAADPGFPLIQLPYNHGTALLRLARTGEALSQFTLALKIDPEHLGTLNNLAICHRQRNELPQAIALLQRAVTLAPRNPELLHNLGATLARSGDDPAAETILKQALQHAPASIDTHRQLAEIYTRAARHQLAAEHTRIALELEGRALID